MKAEPLLLAKTLASWVQLASPHGLSPHLPCEAQLLGSPEAGHVPSHTHTLRLGPSGGGNFAGKGSPLTLQQVMESKVTGALFQTAIIR